ncbi:MAG: hypothetical protein AB1896_08420 [Thermodesulfobacteriota bacterium]
MKKQGPLLERLTHRLAECPGEFLDKPRIGQEGKIFVDAVVSDLLLDLGGFTLGDEDAGALAGGGRNRFSALRLVLVASWLFYDEWFRQARAYAAPVREFLQTGLGGLADLVAADLFVTDPDRREELARLCLAALDLRPEGETEAQAADRLKTLGSVERAKVVAATRRAEEAARKLRREIEKERAREAAAKVAPE